MTLDELPGAAKASAGAVSYGITIAAVAQLLPALATLLPIVWWTIRIFETETAKAFLRWLLRLCRRA